jgi:putative acetyltransferase
MGGGCAAKQTMTTFARMTTRIPIRDSFEIMQVQLESPNQVDVISLIAELDAYQDMLYPAEARYALDLTALEQTNVLFAVVRDGGGVALACGAVVLSGSYGELKRMYVRPAYRAKGLAAQILSHLETEALKRGCIILQLETGPFQPEALAFYRKHSFQNCSAFGDYAEHPLSVFLKKKLR